MNHEYYKSIQFTRFEISAKGILWAVMDDVLTPDSIRFFAKRFPLFYIMLEHKGVTYVLKKGLPLRKYDECVKKIVNRYKYMLK